MWGFKFPIEPVAASRPRVGRWATYYEGPYQDFRTTMKDLVLKVVEKNLGHRTFVDTAFDAAVTFIVQRPSSTTLGWPDPDIDNYQKAIFDQLNLVLFDDDRCIVGVNAEKRWTKTNEKPGIIIELTSLGRFKVPHAKTKTRERSARGTGTVPRVSKQRRGQ